MVRSLAYGGAHGIEHMRLQYDWRMHSEVAGMRRRVPILPSRDGSVDGTYQCAQLRYQEHWQMKE